MQTGRDLGQVEFWQASLERSLARRDQPRRRRAGSVRPVVGAGGISAAALLAVTLPGVLHGRTGPSHQSRAALRLGPSAQRLPSLQPRPSAHLLGTRRHAASRPVLVASTRRPAAPVTQTTAATVTHSVPAVTRPRSQTHPSSPRATTATTLVRHRAGTSAPAAARPQSDPSHPVPPRPPVPSHPAPASPGYVDPLAQASVTSERIDQGVDYSGSGTLGAIGRATVTYVGTTNTGWPGAFIEFRLLSGPDSGRYVYYAESVVP
ncbi:MAG TPA: hypothetical protein VE983_13195, partial [Solirubrobacteraceae bacterium]|nr:hypothetical protein [Solirubrobacteraceae bacterium]